MFEKTIKPDPENPFCPLVKQPCLKQGCTFYSRLQGKNPQTGQEIDQWGCAISMLPLLLVQNANEARKTTAAVEQCRNEIVETSRQTRMASVQATESYNRSNKDLLLSLSAAANGIKGLNRG